MEIASVVLRDCLEGWGDLVMEKKTEITMSFWVCLGFRRDEGGVLSQTVKVQGLGFKLKHSRCCPCGPVS